MSVQAGGLRVSSYNGVRGVLQIKRSKAKDLTMLDSVEMGCTCAIAVDFSKIMLSTTACQRVGKTASCFWQYDDALTSSQCVKMLLGLGRSFRKGKAVHALLTTGCAGLSAPCPWFGTNLHTSILMACWAELQEWQSGPVRIMDRDA